MFRSAELSLANDRVVKGRCRSRKGDLKWKQTQHVRSCYEHASGPCLPCFVDVGYRLLLQVLWPLALGKTVTPRLKWGQNKAFSSFEAGSLVGAALHLDHRVAASVSEQPVHDT